MDDLKKLLKDKLVVTIAGVSDFAALGLSISEFDVFDLHQHWKKWNGKYTNSGLPIFQPISLKRLYFYYKHTHVQDGIHSPVKDCVYTLELFEEYKNIKNTNLDCRDHLHQIDDFEKC